MADKMIIPFDGIIDGIMESMEEAYDKGAKKGRKAGEQRLNKELKKTKAKVDTVDVSVKKVKIKNVSEAATKAQEEIQQILQQAMSKHKGRWKGFDLLGELGKIPLDTDSLEKELTKLFAKKDFDMPANQKKFISLYSAYKTLGGKNKEVYDKAVEEMTTGIGTGVTSTTEKNDQDFYKTLFSTVRSLVPLIQILQTHTFDLQTALNSSTTDKAAKSQEKFADASKKTTKAVKEQIESVERLDDAITISQKGLSNVDEKGSYTLKNGAQSQVINWDMDDNGDPIESPQLIVTNFEQLTKELLKADTQLLKLEDDLAKNKKLFGDAYDSTPIENCINSIKAYIDLLETQALEFATNEKYLVDLEQFENERAKNTYEQQNRLNANSSKREAELTTKKTQNDYKKYYDIIKECREEIDTLYKQQVKLGKSDALTQSIKDLETKANGALESLHKMKDAGQISIVDYNTAKNLNTDGTFASSNSLLRTVNGEMDKHSKEIEQIRTNYQKLGYETAVIDSKLQSLKSAYSDVKNSANDSIDIRIQKELEYKRILDSTNKALSQDVINRREGKQSYQDNLKVIQEYQKEQNKLNGLYAKQAQQGSSQALTNEINLVIDKITKLEQKAKDAQDYINLLFQVGDIDAVSKDKADNLMNDGASDTLSKLAGTLDDRLKKHQDEIDEIKTKYKSWGLSAEEVEEKIAELQNRHNKTINAQKSSITDRVQYEKEYREQLELTIKALTNDIAIYRGQIHGRSLGQFPDFESAKRGALEYAQSLGKVTKELRYSEDIKSGIHTMTTEIRTTSGEVKKLVFNWKDAMSDMVVSTNMLGTELTGLPGIIQQIGKKIKQLGVYWFANMFNPMDLLRYGKAWFNYAKQYDDALTSMRKVTNESIGTLQEFQKESFKLADAVGTTADQLQSSTADFLRLGESLDKAKKSAQEANILFNVSEFENIDDATSSLISMSQAYSELDKMEIIDKLNIVGNNYAIATDELALALQNSASALKVAGNDIDESIALATAANTVIQDYSKVSAGIRTVSMRITGATAEELEEAGEDADGLVETTAKLEEQVKSLTAVNGGKGISLLDDNGNFRSTYEILLDIAEIWEEIGKQDKLDGQNRQNVLLESLAGKNRASILAAILQNPDILRNVYDTSSIEAAGSAQKELENQLESISGHVVRLRNQWQNLWAETANRDIINWFLDLATSILKLADNFGIIKTLLVGGGGIFAAIKTINGEGRVEMFTLSKYAFEEFNGDVYELRIA